jgi:protein gp37
MGDHSAIEWTDATWNPVTGCTKVSPGCKHCYAERLAERLQAMGNPRYRDGFKLTLHPDQISLPLRWRDPRRIFVNSMSDLFHESVPEEFIRRAFDVMVQADWHVFQVLTKRASRLAELAPRLRWPSNVWQGVSFENARYTARVVDLVKVPAAVRFLSVEPLLGPIVHLPLDGIDWVIVGGVTSRTARSPGEYRFDAPIAPSSQTVESPGKPGRFNLVSKLGVRPGRRRGHLGARGSHPGQDPVQPRNRVLGRSRRCASGCD